MFNPLETQFSFLHATSKSKLRALNPEASELIFLTGSFPSVQDASSNTGRWSAEAAAQYSRKLKESSQAARDEGTDPDEARVIRVQLSTGASSVFVGLDPSATLHEIHTALRKSCEDLLVAARGSAPSLPIRLDVRRLNSDLARAVIEAIAFLSTSAGWKPRRFGLKAPPSTPKSDRLTLEIVSSLEPSELKRLCARAHALGNANRQVRTLADLPANELDPKSYHQYVKGVARKLGLKFEFLDLSRLTQMKAGAFLAVARADSSRGAGIAHLTYSPSAKGRSSAKSRKPLVLVGKGICFDTGGYNLKPGGSMLGMHGDMTGSAIALALVSLYAELKVDFEVHAFLALSENLISPNAYKPNEIVTASDGTAIEVVDTDAEGRMILADTLAIARRLKPALCIDFATLTGAAIRALDTRRGAVFSHDEKLAQAAMKAGERSGERVWSFPIGGDYRRELKSKVADLLQCHTSNNADHIYAASFLSHFIGAETPWVHLDLAPAENKGGLGLISTDTTGFGVLWADALIRDQFGS